MPSVVIVTFLCLFYLCFPPVEETSDQVSGSKDLITPEETEKHQSTSLITEKYWEYYRKNYRKTTGRCVSMIPSLFHDDTLLLVTLIINETQLYSLFRLQYNNNAKHTT